MGKCCATFPSHDIPRDSTLQRDRCACNLPRIVEVATAWTSWSQCLKESEVATEECSPAVGGVIAEGWAFTTLICEGGMHLPWLKQRVLAAGARIEQRKISSLQVICMSRILI